MMELKIQAFRYEVVDESGYLEEDTRTALGTAKNRIDTYVLVQMTLCTRHGLPEDMMAAEWNTLDADLWSNLDEMPNDNYILTMWCLVDPLSEKIQNLVNLESAVEDHVRQATNVSKPIAQPLQALHLCWLKRLCSQIAKTPFQRLPNLRLLELRLRKMSGSWERWRARVPKVFLL